MSNVAERIDSKASLANWLRVLGHMYTADLKATPPEVLTASPGGSARAPYEFTAEVIGLCRFTSAVLRGETPQLPDEAARKVFTESMKTSDALVTAMDAVVNELADAITGADDERLTATVMPPWQQETTVYMLAVITVNHFWYHDGQLNLIQTMKGDTVTHWME